MFLWKALQFGLYYLQKLQELILGGTTQADVSFDISIKGQMYTVNNHVTITKRQPGTRPRTF